MNTNIFFITLFFLKFTWVTVASEVKHSHTLKETYSIKSSFAERIKDFKELDKVEPFFAIKVLFIGVKALGWRKKVFDISSSEGSTFFFNEKVKKNVSIRLKINDTYERHASLLFLEDQESFFPQKKSINILSGLVTNLETNLKKEAWDLLKSIEIEELKTNFKVVGFTNFSNRIVAIVHLGSYQKLFQKIQKLGSPEKGLKRCKNFSINDRILHISTPLSYDIKKREVGAMIFKEGITTEHLIWLNLLKKKPFYPNQMDSWLIEKTCQTKNKIV